MLMSEVRGLRLNNPGNIRESDRIDYDWEGEAANDTDPEFEEFISPEYGIRAMARILKSYRRRGVVTLSEIISTWAPPRENDTESYIRSVSSRTGIPPGEEILEHNYPVLIGAIIHHENGKNPYSDSLILESVAMA